MKNPPSPWPFGRRAMAGEAEREGFEPPVPVTVRLISNQVH